MRMLGYEHRDELMSVDIGAMYVNNGDRDRLKKLLQEHGSVADFEFEIRRRDGEVRTMMESSIAVRDAQSAVTAFQGFLLDITDRKRAEQEIRRRNRELLVLNSIAQTLSEAMDLNDSLYRTLRQIAELFKLDAEGKRAAFGTIGEEMTFPVTTYVDSPWVIADRSGKCLEIVLPGRQTRLHTVEANGRAAGAVLPRTVPQAGSEATLRQYIEAVGRGAPDYDRMTSEVAAQTRQQLPFNRAILSRLGALRAMSFRGVSGLGSDIYIAQFANGSAEWRIGLAKDGTIGRIALGPQY